MDLHSSPTLSYGFMYSEDGEFWGWGGECINNMNEESVVILWINASLIIIFINTYQYSEKVNDKSALSGGW